MCFITSFPRHSVFRISKIPRDAHVLMWDVGADDFGDSDSVEVVWDTLVRVVSEADTRD